ncbi:MAG TPA: hypothetical protein VK446_15745 [Methylocystis sp.]|nr:hypothetical protein [Methylocystis sp.]
MSLDLQLIEPNFPEIPAPAPESSRTLVNPISGLANDYLNRFNELVMILEQLPQMPELMEDLLAWKAVSYREHFESSRLPGRRSALEAYERLNPHFRKRFEGFVEELDLIAVAGVAAVRRQFREGGKDIERAAATCDRAAQKMRVILVRASRLVNYAQVDEEPEVPRSVGARATFAHSEAPVAAQRSFAKNAASRA